MSSPVMKSMIVAGAYYDEAKKAIVLRGEIEGVKSEFQMPLTEDHFIFPKHCISKEAEMRKTAELFDSRKGMKVTIQFDGGMINESS